MQRPLSRRILDYDVEWRRHAWPLDWAQVFGRRAPLVLEIGYGNGEFLVEEAARHPERNYLGAEVSWASATRLFHRLDQVALPNVRAVLGEASVLLRHTMPPASLSEVFIHHPCPWPKARHAARRLVQPAFLALLADRMELGACMTLVTDHAEYAAWAAEALEDQQALVSCHATTEVGRLPDRKPTKYQRKAMDAGIDIHYFQWKKVADPHPGTTPIHSVLDPGIDTYMPSVTLQGSVEEPSLTDLERKSVRLQHDEVEIVIRFLATYRRSTGASGLVEVLVKEDELQQEFAIHVLEQEDDQWLVKLAQLGRPHPTFGVKCAVFLVGQSLRTRFPALQLLHDNVGEDVKSLCLADAAEPQDSALPNR